MIEIAMHDLFLRLRPDVRVGDARLHLLDARGQPAVLLESEARRVAVDVQLLLALGHLLAWGVTQGVRG